MSALSPHATTSGVRRICPSGLNRNSPEHLWPELRDPLSYLWPKLGLHAVWPTVGWPEIVPVRLLQNCQCFSLSRISMAAVDPFGQPGFMILRGVRSCQPCQCLAWFHGIHSDGLCFNSSACGSNSRNRQAGHGPTARWLSPAARPPGCAYNLAMHSKILRVRRGPAQLSYRPPPASAGCGALIRSAARPSRKCIRRSSQGCCGRRSWMPHGTPTDLLPPGDVGPTEGMRTQSGKIAALGRRGLV